MPRSSKANATKELLVSTALDILTRGEEVLTMDAVVKRTGVSKGGLVHHFPTKEALMEAAVEENIRRYFVTMQESMEPLEADGKVGNQAYVECSLSPAMRQASADFARGMLRSFGSDFREHSPVLNPWRRVFAERLDRFRQSGDAEGFTRAAILTLAIESFVVIDVLGLYAFTETEVEAIKKALLK